MTGSRLGAAGIGAAVLIAGIVWAALPHGGGEERRQRLPRSLSSSSAAAADVSAQDAISALREDLATEREARIALALEVQALRARVEQLAPEAGSAALLDAPAEPPLEERARADEREAAEPAGSGNRAQQHREEEVFFDEQKLIALGLAPSEAARLRERFEEAEMEELFLRDQAAREGWLHRPRFQRSRERVRRELREEVGDDDYDRMLYAANRPNRVKLTHVLHSSPGEVAGLQAGDVVLRYDGERIFAASDLVSLTRETKSGASVAFDVLRADQVLRFYLPGGPVGARLAEITLAPGE